MPSKSIRCKLCDCVFNTNQPLTKFCSNKCKSASHYVSYKSIKLEKAHLRRTLAREARTPNTCSWCASSFVPWRISTKYCSKVCYNAYKHSVSSPERRASNAIRGSEWRKKHPTRSREHMKKAMSKRRSGGKPDWSCEEVLSANACYSCNTVPTEDNPLEIGHLIPLSRGGSNLRTNVEAQCKRCNRGIGGQFSKIYLLEWVPTTRPGIASTIGIYEHNNVPVAGGNASYSGVRL